MFNLLIDLKKLKTILICAIILAILLAAVPTANAIMTAANAAKSTERSTEQTEKPQGIRMPVLMYHHILTNEKKLNKYTISPEEFEGDLKYIAENGYTTITVKKLIDYCEKGEKLPPKPIMITFDDGYESVYEYAYPLLQKYKMQAVINVIGKYADLYSEASDHNVNYSHITWQQLNEMSKKGVFEVQNHTYDLHTNGKRKGIGKMSGESDKHYNNVVGGDIKKMQQRTQEMMNYLPTAFTYPFGNISSEALPVIKQAGIKAVFCCWERVNYITGESEQLYHINRFNRPHKKSSAEFFSVIEKQ